MATNTNYNNMIKYYATPWDIAFELAKEDYTKETGRASGSERESIKVDAAA